MGAEKPITWSARAPKGLGAVGFAVGLFAPPLLAATAVSAVIGAEAGKLLHRRTARKLEKQAGETISIGGAGLILAYPHWAAAKVEPAATRAIKKAIGEAEGHHVQALKGAIAGRPAENGQKRHMSWMRAGGR